VFTARYGLFPYIKLITFGVKMSLVQSVYSAVRTDSLYKVRQRIGGFLIVKNLKVLNIMIQLHLSGNTYFSICRNKCINDLDT